MADERVRQPVKITDPATDANEAGVNASGQLAIEGPVTNAGTFVVQEDGAALTALQLIDDMMEVDDAAVSVGGGVAMSGLVFDDTTPVVIEEGDAGYQRMSLRREAYMQIRDAAGGERGVNVDASNQLAVAGPVTNAGTFVVQEDGAALTALQKIDNVVSIDDTDVHATGTTEGVNMMAAAVPTDTAVAANDIGMVAMSLDRRLHVDADIVTQTLAALTVTDDGSFTLAANDGVDIGDVDVTSVVPGTGATNLGKAEDVASAAGDTGVAVMAVQDATLSALGSIDGDYTQLRVNANGALHVTGGGGGTEYTEDDAAPANPIASAQSLIRLDTPATLTSADNDIVARRGTNYGAAYTQIVSSTGSFVDSFGSEAVPTTPLLVEGSSTNTAAGSSFDVDTADQASNTRTIRGFVASASVPIKAELIQVDNDVDTAHVTLFARAGEAIIYRAPHRDYHEVTFGGTAGFDGFTVRITNLDNSQAADLYGSIFMEA